MRLLILFIDSTPWDDAEFANSAGSNLRYADPTSAAAGRMDLLTTFMHEMGHVLGLDSNFDPAHQNDLMYAWLQTGDRHTAVDAIFASYGA